MGKAIAKVVGIVLVSVLILGSIGLNIFNLYQNKVTEVTQGGINVALQQLALTIKQNGEFSYQYIDDKGVTQKITLVEKATKSK